MDGTTKIIYNDAREQIIDATSGTLSDLVELEDKFGISSAELEHSPRIRWTTFLLWRIAEREGPVPPFDEWLQSVKTIEQPDQEPVAPVPLERRLG